jgi:prephenate dehydrogenase
VLDPESHDKILSFMSHLPHAVAFSLMNTIPPDYFRFASTGLRDTTRIAASDSQLWADILLSNRRNLKKAIELLQRNLSSIKSAIQKEDRERLFAILKAAKKKRESLDSEN